MEDWKEMDLDGRGRTRGSRGMRNCNKNILYEKKNFKEKSSDSLSILQKS